MKKKLRNLICLFSFSLAVIFIVNTISFLSSDNGKILDSIQVAKTPPFNKAIDKYEPSIYFTVFKFISNYFPFNDSEGSSR